MSCPDLDGSSPCVITDPLTGCRIPGSTLGEDWVSLFPGSETGDFDGYGTKISEVCNLRTGTRVVAGRPVPAVAAQQTACAIAKDIVLLTGWNPNSQTLLTAPSTYNGWLPGMKSTICDPLSEAGQHVTSIDLSTVGFCPNMDPYDDMGQPGLDQLQGFYSFGSHKSCSS